ncbi:MAG: TIGR00289 family protein [Candidatus Aenigmarchaeota archaeon]|nr:TIGR00289 family protein [Candidatus Aenigmarchaeota archaeon]
MKLGVLFSGGKDSCLALQKAKEKDEVVCLITVISENPESFMFHTPNIFLTKLQAEAIDLPLVSITTRGEKEKELEELEKVIRRAKEEHGIEGIVTGAIKSEYQKSRIEKVCRELCLECINPLWHRDEINIMKELVENDFEVIITGVFAEPFGREWLGRKIDFVTIDELEKLERAYKINPSGEGGEIETTVLDAPFFKKRIEIEKSSVSFSRDSGTLKIEKASLMKK